MSVLRGFSFFVNVQAIAMRAGAAVSPAALAQPVVNHRALDAVSAEARKASADTASFQSEGMPAFDGFNKKRSHPSSPALPC